MKGSFARFRLGERIGNLAHLGIHARSGDDCIAPAVSDGRAHIAHIDPVAEGNILIGCRKSLRLLCNGDAFARQRSFFYLEACTFDYAPVRRDCIARFKEHNIADDEIFALYYADNSVTHYTALRSRHRLQSFNGLLCLALLKHSEGRIQEHDYDNNDGIRKAFVRHHGNNARNYRRYEQNYYHRVLKLLEEANYQRSLLGFLQLVGAALLKAPARFGAAEARGARIERIQDLIAVIVIKLHNTTFLFWHIGYSLAESLGVSVRLKKQTPTASV